MTAELQIRQDGNSPPVEGCPKDGVVFRPLRGKAPPPLGACSSLRRPFARRRLKPAPSGATDYSSLNLITLFSGGNDVIRWYVLCMFHKKRFPDSPEKTGKLSENLKKKYRARYC